MRIEHMQSGLVFPEPVALKLSSLAFWFPAPSLSAFARCNNLTQEQRTDPQAERSASWI